jgi:RNA polymerase sigma factor (sigma-70 family)
MNETADNISILSALGKGEEWAFTHVYQLYSRQLLYITEKITGNKEASEDIVAESFIKILKKTTRFDSEPQLKSYLFTIAQHAALDWLRTEKRHHTSHTEIKYLNEGAEETVERTFIQSQLLQTLYAEIERLQPRYREIIIRSFIHRESLTEISEQMGLAYKTVQNLKAKALQQLRIKLQEQELPCITIIYVLDMIAK